MKFCSKCGKEILEEAVICPHCGCSVEATPTLSHSNGLIITSIIIGGIGIILAWVFALLGYICGGIGLGVALNVKKQYGPSDQVTVGVLLSSIALGFAALNRLLGVLLVLCL